MELLTKTSKPSPGVLVGLGRWAGHGKQENLSWFWHAGRGLSAGAGKLEGECHSVAWHVHSGGLVPLEQAKVLPPPRSLQHHLLTKLNIVPAGKGEIVQYHK